MNHFEAVFWTIVTVGSLPFLSVLWAKAVDLAADHLDKYAPKRKTLGWIMWVSAWFSAVGITGLVIKLIAEIWRQA